MEPELYQIVTFNQDLPEHDVKANLHTALLLDRVKHPDDGEDGYVVEILHTQQITAIPISFVNVPNVLDI